MTSPVTPLGNTAEDNAAFAIPEWQKQELDRRYAEYLRGELSLYYCRLVHRELRKRQQPGATKKRKTDQQFPLAVSTGMAQRIPSR